MSVRLKRAAIKANHAEIVAFWETRQDECGLGVDWADAETRCWRCGYATILQRCHIVPDALGGTPGPENLVLLCAQCHREAPNVTDPSVMWSWIRATARPFYDTFWTARGFDEFGKMFGRPAFTGEAFGNVVRRIGEGQALDSIKRYLTEDHPDTIVHAGESRTNPATIAWLFKRAEERLEAEFGPALRLAA